MRDYLRHYGCADALRAFERTCGFDEADEHETVHLRHRKGTSTSRTPDYGIVDTVPPQPYPTLLTSDRNALRPPRPFLPAGALSSPHICYSLLLRYASSIVLDYQCPYSDCRYPYSDYQYPVRLFVPFSRPPSSPLSPSTLCIYHSPRPPLRRSEPWTATTVAEDCSCARQRALSARPMVPFLAHGTPAQLGLGVAALRQMIVDGRIEEAMTHARELYPDVLSDHRCS